MKRVAIVEDNEDNRLLLRAIVGDRYELQEYEDGKEALQGIQDEEPDLLLLDISLPEMDGTEVLQEIRKNDRFRDLPVIALTAHAMSGDRERLLRLGFDDYFSKPILEPEELLDSMAALIASGASPDS